MVLADPPAPDVVGLRFGLELKDDPAHESQTNVPLGIFSSTFLAIMFSISPQANNTLNQPAFSAWSFRSRSLNMSAANESRNSVADASRNAFARWEHGPITVIGPQLRFGRSMHRWKIATCASDQIL